MSALPLEPTNTPSCPRCENRDRVEWDTQHQHWLCCNCWLIFVGDLAEHERMREDRIRYRTRADLFAKRPIPRLPQGETL